MSNLPIRILDAEIQPEHNIGQYELICEIRKTPTVLYGIFTEVIRQFYSQEANLPRPVSGVVWDRDPEKSTIWIDTELRWEDEHPSVRPAIFVGLGEITYSSLTGRSDSLMGMDVKNAEYQFTRSGKGTVQFRHIGQTDGEACVLADATLDYLDAFSRVIRDDFCFTRFELTRRVPLAYKGKESGERWGSLVEMSYEFQDTWTLKLESQLLKKVAFRAGQGVHLVI